MEKYGKTATINVAGKVSKSPIKTDDFVREDELEEYHNKNAASYEAIAAAVNLLAETNPELFGGMTETQVNAKITEACNALSVELKKYADDNDGPTEQQLHIIVRGYIDSLDLGEGTVSEEDIANAVSAYMAENPVSGITDEQISNAVNGYLAENPVSGFEVREPIIIKTTNYAWKTDGTHETDTNGKLVGTPEDSPIIVTGGEKYYFDLKGGTSSVTNVTGVLLKDDSGNVVPFSLNNYKVNTIPSDATKMYITINSTLESKVYKVRQLTQSESEKLTIDFEKTENIADMKRIQYEQQNITVPTYAPFNKAYVTFVHDDNKMVGELTDLFEEKGIPLCFAGIAYNSSGTGSWGKSGSTKHPNETIVEGMRRAVENGGEVLTHHLNVVTADVIDDYDTMYEHFVNTKRIWTDLGFEINGCILAGGYGLIVGDQRTDMWVRKYYEYSDLYGNSEYGYPYFHYRSALSNFTLQTAKEKVDDTIKNKEWTVFYLHTFDEMSKADLIALIDYIKEKDSSIVEVATYKTIHDRHLMVKPKAKLKSIKVAKAQTRYSVNDTFSTSDVSCTAYYSDGTAEKVTPTTDSSKVNAKTQGVYPLIVSYGGLQSFVLIEIVGAGRYVTKTYPIGNVEFSLYSDGVLEFVGNGQYWMPAWGSKEQPWYEDREMIRAINFTGVGKIQGYTFEDMNLDYAILLVKDINASPNAFSNTSVKKLVSKYGLVTYNASDYSGAFNWINQLDIPALEEIHLTDVTVIGSKGTGFPASYAGKVYITPETAPTSIGTFMSGSGVTDVYVSWGEDEVSGAPWGATNATIHYNYTE